MTDAALRELRAGDDDRLNIWLRQPDVGRWWGSAAAGRAKIGLARDTGGAICRMIESAGESVGYAQAMDAGALGGARPKTVPPGAWECDVFIGSAAHRGQGLGQRALDLLVGEVFRSTLALTCVVIVSVRREAAARAFEQIGFRWSEVWDDPLLGPCWVMLRERPLR